jgi:hypothetical protein
MHAGEEEEHPAIGGNDDAFTRRPPTAERHDRSLPRPHAAC